ncbi:glycoside hydrolase [Pyronema domesticum]|nr:glycoside hydrolase [Pyronema domesticum]
MGTGRPFLRASRPRQLLLGATFLIFIFYLLLPHSLDSDSAFQSYSPYNPNSPHPIQFNFKEHGISAADPEKADAVKEAMRETFWRYKEAAWGMDEVRPISGGNRTSRNGWAATLVDTMTTTLVMGLEEEFLMELDYVVDKLDFDHAVDLVDPFETTIRYLGAMVSTVDLLDANFTKFKKPITKHQRDGVLAKAVYLAQKLAPGFDSPTGMIWPRINFTEGKGCREVEGERPYPDYDHATIGPARAGSNWLENYGLARLTGDKVYYENATKAWRPLVYNKWIEEWPGLIDGPWDIMTGAPYDKHRSWGAGHDSYYEYLIKAHILSPHDPHSAKYRDRWVTAVESTHKHLLFRGAVNAPSRSGHSYPNAPLFLHQHRNGWLLNEMGHLACFAGGNLMLGGRHLGNPSITQLGSELVETCRRSYEVTTTGIGPEYFQWQPEHQDGAYTADSEHFQRQNKELGFWITDARWMLRPETVESYFYAYRITGDKKYQQWAWEAFQAYQKAAKAKFGYAEVKDVMMEPGTNNQADVAESFWGAETLKYLYLIFCEEDVAALDEWVFSTEAHPFRIKEGKGKKGRKN